MLSDLTNSIFLEDTNSAVSTVRQNLQVLYVRRLIKMLEDRRPDQMSSAAAFVSLRKIEKIID